MTRHYSYLVNNINAKGKSLEDLHKLMQNGGIFVIVVTKQFRRGEIGGGELVPIDRFFPDISDFDWN
jgi:hypothetical protein